MLIRLFGAGVPVTTGYERPCPVHARLAGKIPQALRGEDDFSTTPEGLDLACTSRTRVTFACELGGLGYGMVACPIWIISTIHDEIIPGKTPVFSEKMLTLH